MHEPATPSTAAAFADQHRRMGIPAHAAALEAACRLMAVHDSRRDALLRMADQWAAKFTRPATPSHGEQDDA